MMIRWWEHGEKGVTDGQTDGRTDGQTDGLSQSHSCLVAAKKYRETSNISRTLVGNKIVDNSDVVGASPVGAAPTTSSFST